MSIGELYLNQTYKVNTLNNTNRAQRNVPAKNVAKDKTDKFEISQLGRDLNTANKALKETPDIRQELVDDIKARFKAGQYEVNTSALADKLLG